VVVILGLAFNAVIQSFANDILMALIAGLFGQPRFELLSVQVGDSVIAYGASINAVVNFLLVAFALFLVVKAMNRLAGKEDEPPRWLNCPFCKTSVPVNATRCPGCTSELATSPG
jgi:large conductance mechanosensitive channel